MGTDLPASLLRKPDLLHGINTILPKASGMYLIIEPFLSPEMVFQSLT